MATLARPPRERAVDAMAESGELLAVESIDRTGLAVTSEGALVRILRVTPPNPLILSDEDRARTAAAYAQMISRLRPEQSLQFYVHSRPVNLDELLEGCRREVGHWSGPPPSAVQPAPSTLARDRWRLHAAMEQSMRLHADDQAAVQTDAYVVVPHVPDQRSARAVLAAARRGLPSAPLERDLRAHRRAARESLAQTDAIRGDLDALSLPVGLLNGEQIVALLWSRFNPTLADAARRRAPRATEILGSLDAPVDAERARRAALRIRAAIAQSALDFQASKHWAEIDRDHEQTIYAATTADATHMGWLMAAMLTRQPFTLSVHIRKLDRGRERTRLKMSYRRTFAINRGAESRGRVPDFDRYAQEHEAERLLAEMAGTDRSSIYEVSIYQSIRARGPAPDAAALHEAVDYCAEQIQSASDCRVQRGEYQQRQLWLSTLPLGRDVARRCRKYATRNAADTVPLLGTSCGSPQGIPFAFADPGRSLELLDPYDRAHANQTLLINGRSGSGKTMAANVILSRCVAHGAKGYVLDRAGHYAILTRLIDGARQIDIGADHSPHAINPWDVEDCSSVPLEKLAFLVSLHGVMMGEEGLSTLERSQLGAAIRAVYVAGARHGVAPRESYLRDELLARAAAERDDGDASIAAVLRNLAERLGEFCDDGAYAYLLDRQTNVPHDAPLVVFDTRRCPDVVLKPVMFSIVEYVTRSIERHRDAHRARFAGRDTPMFAGRTILLIDEGWHLVARRETGEYANDLARRARHLGLFLIVMSQHLSDFATEHGLALIRNSTLQLFLTAHPDEIAYVRDALRLSAEEAALLARLKTVKGSHSQMFWVNGTRGRGQVALRIGPTEYWAFTSDEIRDVPARDAKIAEHDGDVWAAIADLARNGAPGGG